MTTLDAYVQAAQRRFRTRVAVRRWPSSTASRQTYLALVDALIIAVAALAANAGRLALGFSDMPIPGDASWAYYAIPAAWLALLALNGAYSLNHLQHGMIEYQRVASASGMLAGAIGISCYLTQFTLPRGFFMLLFLVGVPALLIGRFTRRQALNKLRARGMMLTPVIVAGAPAHIDDIAKVLRREKWLGYQIVGAVTSAEIEETRAGIPVIGDVSEVVDLVSDTEIDAVIFAEGSFPTSQHFKRMAWELEEHDVQMVVVPALTDISAERLNPRPVAGLPLVHVERPQAMQASRWVKRAFDLIGSSILLLLSAPLMAAVAIAIKLEDGGPILFKQVRVGRRGEEFECLKVRSMVVDAEAKLAELAAKNEGAGVLFKMTKDPRITRVGQFIRRFSIDEVPQFWNVFRGDMSLVGPRPALPKEVAQYDRDAVRRLDVRPGLTGLWQVSGRSDLPWDETVRLDVYYVDNWSIIQDLSILMRTAGAVLGSRGAY